MLSNDAEVARDMAYCAIYRLVVVFFHHISVTYFILKKELKIMQTLIHVCLHVIVN
jgi:hypothetical protein